MKKERRHPILFLFFLTITLLLAVMIYRFSAQPAAESDVTSGVFVLLLSKLLRKFGHPRAMSLLVVLVRKGAHFFEYFLLGLFFSLTVRQIKRITGGTAFFCWFCCSLYAASDEVHQHFVPGRSCQLRDVCIDAAGALLGVTLGFLGARIRRKND